MGDEVRSLEGGGGGSGRCKGTEKEAEASPARWKADNLISALRSKIRCEHLLANLREVLFGTKLCLLLPAVPLAVAAHCYHLGHAWVFALSLAGLAPLAERVSFLSEQIAYYSGPTVGGLLNATCGNAPELIIALLALHKEKIGVLKWSLLGSILSNLLLVLGSSLFCGSLANLYKERIFDQRQADVNISLLLLSATCHILALMYQYTESTTAYAVGAVGVLKLSRYCSIVMLLAYFSCLFFQLKTHRQHFEAQEEEDNDNDDRSLDAPQIGFASSSAWLIGMTIVVAVLSDYVVGTVEAVSDSWDISVSFISIILLPLVGNAAEHASAIIFAFKNNIDIALSVTLGSASQISMFVIPLCVIVAWTKGINLDLDFNLLETGSLAMAILITAFSLQDGTWQYYKGSILLFCYFIISALFFILKTTTASNMTTEQANVNNLDAKMTPTRFLKV